MPPLQNVVNDVSLIVDSRMTSDWRFGSVRHLDEAASGPWRLQVSDRLAEDAGTWTGWNLTIWGRR